jgi:hypothetical protein
MLAMNHKTTFSSAAAAFAASLAMVMSTSALGACKTTLRGELVQAPQVAAPSGQAFPRKLLFFSLDEITQANIRSAENRFASFTVPNTSTTLPIPFVLYIDSPKDCPSELELNVSSDDSDLPVFRFGSWQAPLFGRKTIRLYNFETIPVWGPRF